MNIIYYQEPNQFSSENRIIEKKPKTTPSEKRGSEGIIGKTKEHADPTKTTLFLAALGFGLVIMSRVVGKSIYRPSCSTGPVPSIRDGSACRRSIRLATYGCESLRLVGNLLFFV
jgi:hypothetical protein